MNWSHRRSSVLSAVAALATLALAPAERAVSPWELLEQLRDNLRRSGPTTTTFEQTFIPAGSREGDTESGHLSIWLPDCLRWDYFEPQAKSFLLCNDEAYYWNEDELRGRHYRTDPAEEPGLDLLLVEVARLKERYVASHAKLVDGTHEISLALPPQEGTHTFRAKIRLEPVSVRMVGMEYTDEEGNLTQFTFSDYQQLRNTALFQPPQDVEWTEE